MSIPGTQPPSRSVARWVHRVAIALVIGTAAGPAAAIEPTFRTTPLFQPYDYIWLQALPMNVDGDANLDLVAVGVADDVAGMGHVTLMHGAGDGTFTTGGRPNDDTTLVGSAGTVVSGDVNGDGREDVIVGGIERVSTPSSYFARIELLIGAAGGGLNHSGTIQRVALGAPPSTPLAPPIALGDIGGDGALDLAYVDQSTSPANVRVLIGNGRGEFAPGPTPVPITTPTSMSSGDLNGDRRRDLVVTGASTISILLTSPTSATGFQPPTTLSTSPNTVSECALVDVDQDGALDLIVTTFGGMGSDARLHRGLGRGAFDPTPSPLNFGASPKIARRNVDLNGDGYPDPLSQGGTLTPVSVLPSTDGGPFGAALYLPGAFVNWATPGDFDSDGRADWALAGFLGVTTLVNTTPYPPPVATTGDATNGTRTSLTLTGAVRPRLQASTYHFEYGPTTAYGSRTPDIPIAPDTFSAPAAANLTQPTAGLTLHYRLVVTNRFGTGVGADRVTTTPGLIGGARVTSRWKSSRQLGSLQLNGLPARTGALTLVLRAEGTQRALLRKRVALSPRRRTVTHRLPTTMPPGRYQAFVTGPDEAGTVITQIIPFTLAAPKEGYARAFFSRADGGRQVTGIRRGARVIWVNYRFVADPAQRHPGVVQRCVGPIRIAPVRRAYKRTLIISLSTGRVLPAGRYTCTLRVGRRQVTVAQTTVLIR